jgi:predicted membrane channel-forming protein YqfA (hemolysin III family)
VQLLPEVRRRWPALHRWNGRAFMLAALIATLSGFYLTWVRGSQLNLPSALATSANGLLIVVFVALAWRSALRRDIAAHREHALRAWVLVNGVWFLRIGLMLAGVSLAPFGVRMDVDGPLFLAVSVLSWAAPLALLQLYLWAGREASPAATRRVAWTFHGLTVLTAVGSLAAIVLLWAPRL